MGTIHWCILYATVALLHPDTVGVLMVGKVVATSKVVGVDVAGGACEILKTIFRWFPSSTAGYLHDVDVPGPGGEAQGVAVVPGLHYHMVPSVGTADNRRCGAISVSYKLSILTLGPTVRRGGGDGGSVGLVYGEG